MKNKFFQRLSAILTFIIIYSVLIYYFKPGFIFSSTTTNGGDTGAHHYIAYYLSNYLLPKGSITGWSPDWYAGFPILKFYFPLPYLIISLLRLLIHYNIAFKLVTILGIFLLPYAIYYYCKALKPEFLFPEASAVLTLSFLFLESYSIYGGNILSTLAGEFPFSISLALLFFFLGIIQNEIKDKQKVIKPVLVLTAMTHSHILSTFMALLVSPVILLSKKIKIRFLYLLKIFILAFCLSAWWSIPFIFNLEYTASMHWDKLEEFSQLFTTGFSPIFFLAFLGLILMIIKKDWSLLGPSWLMLSSIILFWLLPDGPLWNARFIPFFLTGSIIIAAYGIYSLVNLFTYIDKQFKKSILKKWLSFDIVVIFLVACLYFFNLLLKNFVINKILLDNYLIFVGLFLLLLFIFIVSRLLNFETIKIYPFLALLLIIIIIPYVIMNFSPTVPSWIKWNYTGYENKKNWSDIDDLMAYLKQLSPGRVLWEYTPDYDRYGTPRVLELIPYFSQQPTMEGLLIESSSTAPFHFILQAETSPQATHAVQGIKYPDFDLQRGFEHMQMFNTKYFIAFSDVVINEAKSISGLSFKNRVGPFYIFQLEEKGFVSIPEYKVNLIKKGNWRDISIKWMKSRLSPEQPVVYGEIIPKEEWRAFEIQVQSLDQVKKKPISKKFSGGLEVENDKIIFTTTHVGQPHLVNYSYFPNWITTGADGPYLVSPSLMMVIPKQKRVTLEYKPLLLDKISWFISFISYLGIFIFTIFWFFFLKKQQTG